MGLHVSNHAYLLNARHFTSFGETAAGEYSKAAPPRPRA
jgi:hypothetical protein